MSGVCLKCGVVAYPHHNYCERHYMNKEDRVVFWRKKHDRVLRELNKTREKLKDANKQIGHLGKIIHEYKKREE